MKTAENNIFDPMGIEIFAIDETFESLFNGLKGVYFRLYYKESLRPDGERNPDKEASYFKRFREIGRLKNSYRYNDWAVKRKAVETYSDELHNMVDLELKDYATIG
ncbi:MAG: hypothetical protein V4456_11700 [Bacteroidota bacterium]